MEEPILTRFDPDGPADRLAGAVVADADRRRADAHGRSGHHAQAARHHRRRAGERRRRHRARADRRAAAAAICRRPASSVAQVVQALQSQNLAAPVGRLERRARRAHDPAQGPPRDAGRFRAARRAAVATAARPARRRRRRAGRHRGAAHRRRCYNDEEAVGIDIVKSKGYSTTAVADAVARARSRRSSKTLPAGVDAARRARRRRARRRTRWQTSRRRSIEGALLTVLVVFLFLNSWRSTVITGLALPVSVLASFIAVLGVRLHAEHDDAARPVARDRHPDRRRDRRAREHRAPRRDGQGPLHARRTRAPTRSAWR